MAKNVSPGLLNLALALFVIFMFMNCGSKRSTYVLEPRVLTISEPKTAVKSIFDLKQDITCVPGPSEDAAYYTVGLNAVGVCGDQRFVAEQAEGYTILDGIGGSLLEQ
jgi:hypothetical protein